MLKLTIEAQPAAATPAPTPAPVPTPLSEAPAAPAARSRPSCTAFFLGTVFGLILAAGTYCLLFPSAPQTPSGPGTLGTCTKPPSRMSLQDYVDFVYLLPPEAKEARESLRELAAPLIAAAERGERADFVHLPWQAHQELERLIPPDASAAQQILAGMFPLPPDSGMTVPRQVWEERFEPYLRDLPIELRFLRKLLDDRPDRVLIDGYGNVQAIERAVQRARELKQSRRRTGTER